MVKHLTNPFRERPAPLGSLLSAASQRLSAELDASLQAAGFSDLRAAHAAVFMAIDAEGTRLTELAHRIRMTKQAAGELVRYLADHDYVDVMPDPSDGRAKIVRLTARGWTAIRQGAQVVADFDAWLERSIGAEQVNGLRDALTEIVDSAPLAGAAARQSARRERGTERPLK